MCQRKAGSLSNAISQISHLAGETVYYIIITSANIRQNSVSVSWCVHTGHELLNAPVNYIQWKTEIKMSCRFLSGQWNRVTSGHSWGRADRWGLDRLRVFNKSLHLCPVWTQLNVSDVCCWCSSKIFININYSSIMPKLSVCVTHPRTDTECEQLSSGTAVWMETGSGGNNEDM